MKTSYLETVLAIAGKDLRVELRSRELISVMAIFALLSILVFSFALELDRRAREEAVGGVLWVTLIFASLLGLNRSLAQEYDLGNLDALLLAPAPRSAIFVGKFAGNALFTGLVSLLLLPLMTALYGMDLLDGRLIATTLGRRLRFLRGRDAAGDHDCTDAGARGAAADRHAAAGFAIPANGTTRDQRHLDGRGGVADLVPTASGDHSHLFRALPAPLRIHCRGVILERGL